nr:hypothetical protein CFP56_56436 [Quercus suber]
MVKLEQHIMLRRQRNNTHRRISPFFHGPQRHRTPFVAKLVGVVAVEIIVSAWLSIKYPVTCKVDGFDVLEHINNLCALE